MSREWRVFRGVRRKGEIHMDTALYKTYMFTFYCGSGNLHKLGNKPNCELCSYPRVLFDVASKSLFADAMWNVLADNFPKSDPTVENCSMFSMEDNVCMEFHGRHRGSTYSGYCCI